MLVKRRQSWPRRMRAFSKSGETSNFAHHAIVTAMERIATPAMIGYLGTSESLGSGVMARSEYGSFWRGGTARECRCFGRITRKAGLMRESDGVPVIETERLRMRGHRIADFEECAAMWAEPEVVRYTTG